MLSTKSIENYEKILKRLAENGITEDDIVNCQSDVVDWIEEEASPSGSVNSKALYLSSVLYLLKTKYPEADASAYKKQMTIYSAAQKERSKSQTLPIHKLENLLPWKDILALKDKAKELHPRDYLIYCLYTMQPPVRADFTPMIIQNRTPKSIDNNYLIVTKDIKNWTFIFNQYKLKQSMGQIILDIPYELKRVILDYIKEVGLKSGDKLIDLDETAFSKRVISIFKKLTGKRMGISLLRHSFITDFLSTPRSIKQKEEMGRRMMHSRAIQETYAIIDD